MDKKLFIKAIFRFFLGVLMVGFLLFVPAGSFDYWNAWLFMGLLFIPMFIAGIVMMIKNPKLLERRLNLKEREKDQKEVIAYSGLMFLLGFIMAGINYRFCWFEISNTFVIIASTLFIISYVLYAEVLRENEYLLRTIEVEKDQKLVDTGLYGIVRHPMYATTLILFLTMPLILGSLVSFKIFLAYPLIIAKRIKNEEEVLERDLKGYKEYKEKVKYKMIPYIW